MMHEGMPASGGPGAYRFELAFCRRWMERWLLDHHGGTRAGAGRKNSGLSAQSPEVDATEHPGAHENGRGGGRSALDEAIAGGLVLERPEDIRALLGKVSAREAATIRSMVASMRQLHDLQVEQAKYVLVSDVEARLARMVGEAASMMEDATRRAADAIAAAANVDAGARASIEESIRAELARVRDTLAERKA
jgi:hypothetical protein